jgi:hypothetical protein
VKNNWSAEEIVLLTSNLSASQESLEKLFKNRSWLSIRNKAYRLGWKKPDTTAVKQELPIEEKVKYDRKIALLEERVRELVKRYKQVSKESGKEDALIGAIYEVLPLMPPIQFPQPLTLKGGVENESAVLLLGDFHFGEQFDEEEMGGISIYNMDVAERRFNAVIDRAIMLIKEKMLGYNIVDLYVFGLGDFVSGIIHDELVQNNEINIIQQVTEVVRIVGAGLLKLSQYFNVHFVGVVGNHGRVTQKIYFQQKARNNYDYLCYIMMQRLYGSQERLTFTVPKAFWTIVEIENTRFMLQHGDTVKSWGGIPFYGLSRAYGKLRTLTQDYAGDFQHLVIGHYHNGNWMNYGKGKLIINGSLKGGDPFSVGAISAACDPSQYLFGVHRKHGITWTFEINVADIR